MDYLFYKSSKSYPVVGLDILDLRNKYWSKLEEESYEIMDEWTRTVQKNPQNIEVILSGARKILGVELPFALISEEVLSWHHHSPSNEMRIIVPQNVDYIFEFSLNESTQYGIEMEYDPDRYNDYNNEHEADLEYLYEFTEGDLRKQKIKLKLLHRTNLKAQKPGERFFLFIRNFNRTSAAIFQKYEPRFYKLDSRMNDRKLVNITYNSIPEPKSDKPVAVIVHGFMSFTEENFDPLKKALVASDLYSAIYGFSYPPNRMGIRDSGAELKKVLEDARLLFGERKIDLYAHSEGGLVCRSMIVRDLKNCDLEKLNIRHLVTAGTPHLGTPLANMALQGLKMVNFSIYIVNMLIGSCLHGHNLESIHIMKQLMLYSYLSKTGNLGLKDLATESEFLEDLNLRCQIDSFNIDGSVILVSYELPDHSTVRSSERIWFNLINCVFKKNNDSVVSTESSAYEFTPSKPFITLPGTGKHSQYYGDREKADVIVNAVVSLERVPATQLNTPLTNV
ncbi:hypothetical protein NST38_30620 [Paenibacillus sp. FSL H8-0104]|uniref:lipase family alpha/beta hydrolase n=1 Tax=Paenibacillus sp. FSL H8-0104 TaxID=2954509 RepID=UPI0030FD3238